LIAQDRRTKPACRAEPSKARGGGVDNALVREALLNHPEYSAAHAAQGNRLGDPSPAHGGTSRGSPMRHTVRDCSIPQYFTKFRQKP